MKNKITILILFIVLGFYGLQAQVTQEWVQRYGGPGEHKAQSLAVDDSGNVYVTGSSASGAGVALVTIKYNSSGDSLWVQRYDGGYEASLAVDDSGNVYVAGYNGPNIVTIKYNTSGVQQWIQSYNGPARQKGQQQEHQIGAWILFISIALGVSGDVYVSGSNVNSGNNLDYVTIKYNSSGVQGWVQLYNAPGNSLDYANSLAVDGSGNVYVTGFSSDSTGTGPDYATIKYNSSGDSLWVQRYDGPGNNSYDLAYSLAVDGWGNVCVTGVSNGDYATIKYNSSGDSLWVARYNGTPNGYDWASSLAVDSSGNVFVTGGSQGISGDEYATIKYSSSGVQLWVQKYDGGPQFFGGTALSLAVDSFGNVYVTGGGIDYATIKYNLSGVQQWVQRYTGPGNAEDLANSLAVDNSGNVFVTGQSIGIGTGYDYATIKYSQSTGISQTSSSIPEKFSLLQNYPNPFNPTTNLEFGISKLPSRNNNSTENYHSGGGFVSLKIYDMLGKEVATLVNTNLNPGTYKYNFDASALSSGVYFYKLQTDNFSETKKMTLLK